jgi:hypothetical protein
MKLMFIKKYGQNEKVSDEKGRHVRFHMLRKDSFVRHFYIAVISINA